MITVATALEIMKHEHAEPDAIIAALTGNKQAQGEYDAWEREHGTICLHCGGLSDEPEYKMQGEAQGDAIMQALVGNKAKALEPDTVCPWCDSQEVYNISQLEVMKREGKEATIKEVVKAIASAEREPLPSGVLGKLVF